ncbi:toprim domain-containing protein [Rhizobium sp. PL01]|uniref:toprim domain-containing protein n=1 Tax=Rhizobium sp. PL01 TaxID=3085631 RepID=UPI00399544F9
MAAIEQTRPDTLYVSTGGGWSPLTAQALETLASGEGAWLVAATDNNVRGEVFADRLRQMAECAGCDFSRLRPEAGDWNEELKVRRERGELPHTRPNASRVKLPPARRRPLTRCPRGAG